MIKPKIYLAGPLNAMAVDYIRNLNKMIHWDLKLRRLGYSVFDPCLDLLVGLLDGEFEYQDYTFNNIPWLKVADALFVLPDWELSVGTKKEIEIARSHHIPVFFELNELQKAFPVE